MKDLLEKIRAEAMAQLKDADVDVEALRIKYLGKKGELTAVLRGMGALSPEERPKIRPPPSKRPGYRNVQP